jgi:hypothetical protein
MRHESTRIATFASSAFNTVESKSYFINACCFGDDLAMWLIAELRRRGVTTDDKPGQEDFGWYLNFKIAHKAYTYVVAYRPDDQIWIVWVERNAGLLASLFGGRSRGVGLEPLETLHAVLIGSDLIRDVRWHFELDSDEGKSESGFPTPSAD